MRYHRPRDLLALGGIVWNRGKNSPKFANLFNLVAGCFLWGVFTLWISMSNLAF